MKRALFLACMLSSSPLAAEILKVKIDGGIDPVTAEFIQSAVERAREEEAEMLLIQLSTPGGWATSMQEIIQQILNSEVPIVCYVHPQGTHAASAGFFILLASDVAAMSPGTNTGAATPVFPFGGENETLLAKVKNDALANLRSIVERRQRNYEMAAKAVEEAQSFTDQEALEGGLIDLVAEDEADLLAQLDGREISRFTGEKQILKTRGQRVVEIEMTFRQRLLSTLAQPNLALILGLMGLVGLYFEFTNPGMVVPGVVGGICLLLGLMGFAMLPINMIGVLLLLLAVGFFIAEIKVQGFGVLGIGGAVAMFLGLLLLIDSPFPDLRIDPMLALGAAISFAVVFLFLMRLAFHAVTSPVLTGNEGLVGRLGVARSEVNSQGGKVFIVGEWWDAVSAQPVPAGARIRVVQADRLSLTVEAEERLPRKGQKVEGSKSPRV
ncbi:MAG: nodulation protein NfeD [Acidobacteriota bacterium]